MKKTISTLMVMLSSLGCGQEIEVDTHLNVPLKNCGITGFGDGFVFYCGLADIHLPIIKDVADVPFEKEQLCDVHYAPTGQPTQFNCRDIPVKFDEYLEKGLTFHGDWVCTGLDGFGGYDHIKLSNLTFNENGMFEVELLSKLNTDSVWYVKDSILKGTYTVDAINKIRLAPETWGNELINMASPTRKDALQFMLASPTLLEITSLSESGLAARLRLERTDDILFRRVSCERPKRIVAATE
jgi:hypothetical protein